MASCLRNAAVAALFITAVYEARPHGHDGTAPEQQSRTHKFGPGECGPVDPTYIHLANETGGQPFFLNPSEVTKAFHYVRESSGGHDETLLWAAGTFVPGPAQEYAVPIDSTVRRVTFSLSVDTSGSDFVVADPAGAAIAAADSRTEITVLNCGRIITIDAPAHGIWHVRAAGVGRFWMTTHARSDLSFVSADFMRAGGRPGHEGFFRIHGQPLAGAPATLRTVVSREHVRSAAFDLVSMHGDVLGEIRRKPDPSDDGDEYLSIVELPSRPFRVRATGLDDAGRRFQRVFHTLFHAETVEVTPGMTVVEDVAPGTSGVVPFNVRNIGAAATFRIVAADGRRMITKFEPATVALEPGASATINVWINVPADAAPGTGTDITVTATSDSQPQTTNGASIHVAIKN
jgi:von Willebrand factor A domain-containing protein 7